MIGSWISPPEKLTSPNALLSAMHVPGWAEHLNVFRYGRAFGITAQNVEDGFGRQTGNGGTSHVFQGYDESGSREELVKS
jgi:hypothetical protein